MSAEHSIPSEPSKRAVGRSARWRFGPRCRVDAPGIVARSLLLLTGLTTKVVYIDLGHTAIAKTHTIDWNTVVALVIAVAKMLLVVLFFMHVKYSSGLTRLVIVAAFFWLAIMIA